MRKLKHSNICPLSFLSGTKTNIHDFIHLHDSKTLLQVRRNLFGHTEPIYSGYTCYTGIADFVPVDIETVGCVLCLLNNKSSIMILIIF